VITNPSDPRDTVIVGAGRLGQIVAKAVGSAVVAFADNDAVKHRYAAVPTLSLKEAHERYPDARYVVAIWGGGSTHRIKETEAELTRLGVWRIEPVGRVLGQLGRSHYWLAPPETFTRDTAAMTAGFDLWEDLASRREYSTQLAARLTADPSVLPEPCDGAAYWRPELIRFSPDDVIVDGGAYDGDSLRAYLSLANIQLLPWFQHWIAVEPDTTSYVKLRDSVKDGKLPFTAIHAALGAENGTTHLISTGTVDSRTGDTGTTVPVRAIDNLIQRERLSFIKLDIEGDEMAALNGGWQRIAKDRPTLAISVYHKPCDLWQIPLAIKAHCPDYRFHLRAFGAEGWDLVCIAIPPERCA
jgi:FkbM family methyltransferase